MRADVPAKGLRTAVPGGGTMQELAEEVVEIAAAGLTARARLNAAGDNETGFLDPLRDILARKQSPADALLEAYHGRWNGAVDPVYDELSF